jgi:pimeloyl-ACP methyl ester carboxylesterase
MAREMWLVMWTQPLLPVFQIFFGARMGSGGGSVPVVFVHGYFQNRVDFLYLASRLRKAGAGPLFACNFFWPQSLERSSATVERFVEWVRMDTGVPAVDLVTHSTGGLFALDMLESRPEVVRRVAMIALPGKGVPWRGPLVGRSGTQLRADSFYRAQGETHIDSTPALSIYSAHDNVVHPASTSHLDGPCAHNVEFDDPGHLSVLFDREIADEVCRFLLAEELPADPADAPRTEGSL